MYYYKIISKTNHITLFSSNDIRAIALVQNLMRQKQSKIVEITKKETEKLEKTI